ncbi:GNAT family N-acetyltransferase [Gephyromycinifex aptenodytis]|uniref:GNAT family N-acetyltransferase n=1 Tax=Gephyromycinifex aptenodytis TaxID=2716227 RepID=UPI0014451C7B|nr:GNAT family N-acetyltransferase [Gephyromycinifex aptenodytis]
MTVRIERAHVRDVKRVKPLWQLLVQRYADVAADDWPVRDANDAWQRRHQDYLTWINEASGVIFIAWEGEGEAARAIGYAALRFVDSGAAIDLGERVGEMESLAVYPEHHGKGIGTSLITACRRELERREIAFCCIETLASNEQAVALCERNGFRPYMVRLIRRIELD